MHVLTSDTVRVVSDDKIAAYRRDGWVKLPGLVSPEWLAGSAVKGGTA